MTSVSRLGRIYNSKCIYQLTLFTTLDNVDDYEKHFTVMNYSNYQMTQVHYQTFIQNVEKEHKDLKWASVQKDINSAIKGKQD
jgi:hypothetical protein